MKKVLFIIIICSILFIVFFLAFTKNSNNKELIIKTNEITKVTIQYKTKVILIENSDEINKLFNNYIGTYFSRNNISIGSKGWLYWIECYNKNDKLIYNFSIQSNNIINYKSYFYKSKKMDLSYVEKLFKLP